MHTGVHGSGRCGPMMTLKPLFSLVSVAAVMVLGGMGLLGGPATHAAAPGWPPDPALVRYPDEILLSEDPAVQETLRRTHAGVRDFLQKQPSWKATVDPFTQGVDRAFGDGLAMSAADPTTAGKPDAYERPGREFVQRFRGLFNASLDLSPSSLVFNEKSSVQLPDPSARVVQFDLFKDGLAVLGAGLTMAMRDERIFFVSTSALGPVAVSSSPRLDADGALDAVKAYLQSGGALVSSLSLQREPSLAFFPRVEPAGATSVLRHHLIWILQVKPDDAPFYEGYIAYVDASDGEVLALFPEAQNAGSCSADPQQAHGTVQGGVRPNRADDVEVVLNFPFARVNVGGTLVSTDLNGRYPYPGGPASSGLQGEFFRAHCDNCVAPVGQPSASAGETGLISFGIGGASGGSPVAGNGTSTPADRSTFYHLNQTRMLLQKWDNAFFDEIDPFVNILDTCNAFSAGYMLGFFPSGAGCRNSGEIRDVVQHELGHTWDRLDGNGITDSPTSEWKGDVMALTMGGDSCVGESFFLSGGPTTSCSGVRDIDEKAAGRTDHPLTPAVCPTCATLTRTVNGCFGEVHCVGEIPGQASWHLLRNLLAGADDITGAALPAGNPALSAEQARWVLERLLIAGGPPMQTFNPNATGTSIYDVIMLADDDDGNLANGTPHAAYVNAAFSHHQIAENPLVGDSADCAALSDPIVSAIVDRDAATGLPSVRITWTPVGGATTFDVYRNTRAGDAFLQIARDVSAGPVVDAGVQSGVTYRYFVAAVRKTGCAAISPGANVTAVAVAPAELRVFSKVVTEVPGGSDGDGRIEPGERVSVQIMLQETGGAASATGVTASLTSGSIFSPITAAGPVSFGTVPAGGTTAGSAAFEVFVGPSEACGGRVHLIVSATGNEGCWLDGLDVLIATSGAGCAPSASAFVEVVPGSAQVVSGGGDGDLIADNCETTTVAYQIRNAGSVASGPVVSSAMALQPGVTFVPESVCAPANLGPGASSPCQFSFSMGGATSSGVPFLLTADSAGNPAPSSLEVVLGAETNPSVFTTLTYGFEGSFQGWSAQQFSISSVRAFSGTTSAHAGSMAINNICGKLTSPPLLLNPSSASTLSFQFDAIIEPFTNQWYDRANVHVVDVDTGQHSVISPVSGLAYNASGNPQGQICHITGEAGWGGIFGAFNPASFDLSAYAGHRVRIEINYNSDEGDDREGIYVDDVMITNAALAAPPPDLQGDTCSVPEVSALGAMVLLDVNRLPGDLYRLTWQDLGQGYQYNIYAGAAGTYYSHGVPPLVCSGVGTGVTCDGTSCRYDQPGAGLPGGNLYFEVTASGFGVEGPAGFASNGMEIDPARSTCQP